MREFFAAAKNKGGTFSTLVQELQGSFWPSEIADDRTTMTLDNLDGSAQIWLIGNAPSAMAIALRPVRTTVKQDWSATFHLETPARIIKIAALAINK